MSNEAKDEFGITEIDEDDEVILHPGDCFGWYSHVSPDCHAGCCLRSEWCKSYTLNRANQSESSIKKDLDDIGENSDNNIIQKKVSKNVMADLGRQAFFDGIVNLVASNVNHDNIKYSPNRNTASIKVGGKVIVFLNKKRTEVLIQIGGRNKSGASMRMAMGENNETIQNQICSFLEKSIKA